MIGIYKVTSPSGKIYIGQSTNIQKRFRDYKAMNNCKSQTRLYRSLIKHGAKKHSFNVITECDLIDLNKLERYWQDFYDACGINGLNCMLTKSEYRSGYSILKGEKRKPRSEDTKMKLRLANLGKKATKECKCKMSLAHKGNKYNLGRKASDSTKLKMSQIRKGNKYSLGIKHSDEAKRNMAESKLFRNIILDTSNGVYYYDFKSASDCIGMDNSHFMKLMKGRYKNKTTMILV